MNETLRLYPPIHLGQRIAARDLDFQGYRIPAGQRVLYSIYLTHRDPKVWPAPAAFIPGRFAPDAAHPPPYTFLPFGGGPRNCIGMAFAQVEVKVVLARILQQFDLKFSGHSVRPAYGCDIGATSRRQGAGPASSLAAQAVITTLPADCLAPSAAQKSCNAKGHHTPGRQRRRRRFPSRAAPTAT